MEIKIENCNSIDLARITIEPNKLNIKFAPNGTGKSTIANALYLSTFAGEDLNQLLPFKLRQDNPEELKPKVSGSHNFCNVMRFNENYISQFVFQKDEVLTDSFNILLKNEEYIQIENDINELMQEIRGLFVQNPELENLISTLKEMTKFFNMSKTGLAKNSMAARSLSDGNKIKHIPQGLESYQPFIQSSKSIHWIDWQQKGQDFLEMSENCPFCTSHTGDKKQQISRLAEEYDKKNIENLVVVFQKVC